MPFDGVPTDSQLQQINAVIGLLDAPDKWCQGALRSQDERYCIRGAMHAIDGANVLEPAIRRAIGQVTGKYNRSIETFNDHPNTNHELVIAVLDRARLNLARGDAIIEPPAAMSVVRQGARVLAAVGLCMIPSLSLLTLVKIVSQAF